MNEYKYLRNKIERQDDCCTNNIISILNLAKSAFQNKKNILTPRNIDIKVRKNLLKTFGVYHCMKMRRGP